MKTNEPNESFRDKLSTVDEKGGRIWVFPKKPFGQLFEKRKIVSYLLLVILIVTPFIKVGGNPLFLFDIFNRKFILFGQIFWPQDFYLFGLGMIVFFIFIILFTTVFGRVWCGWICPQTIFMEMVFRRVEYAIDGDMQAQKKLKAQAWNGEKIRKRLLKWSIFLFFSFIIAHIVLAWIIGIDKTLDITTSSPANNWVGFIAMTVITLVIFGIYMRFREQMCTTFCPYGRLQGVLLGKDSIVVAYNDKRGEPRERVGRRRSEEAGDCIDCDLCVQVCPTGIDIRNGTQMECVNCTACIDACDSVMHKLNLADNLIGYHSEDSIETGKKFAFSVRQKAYVAVLGLLTVILTSLLVLRNDAEFLVMRNPGSLYFVDEEKNTVGNLYQFELINKTLSNIEFELVSDFDNAIITIPGANQDSLVVVKEGLYKGQMLVSIPMSETQGLKTPIKFTILDKEGKVIDQMKSSFFAPQNVEL